MKKSDINQSYWKTNLQPRASFQAHLNHNLPELSNLKVRLALNYAINKSSYINQLNQNSLFQVYPTESLIFSNDLKNNDSISAYLYNPELANQLLDEAGYLKQTNGYRFSLEITGVSWVSDEINILIEDLNQVGIQCTPRYQVDANWWNDFYDGNFDI